MLLKARVAAPNPDYDLNVPFSRSILITRPERIVSFDERRLELDCTASTTKARSDHIVRAGKDDRGESLATKSSSTASMVCGGTGTGKALPPYIVFSSGKTMHSDWCQPYTSQLQDADGKPLPWRYDSNEKGSPATKVWCSVMGWALTLASQCWRPPLSWDWRLSSESRT